MQGGFRPGVENPSCIPYGSFQRFLLNAAFSKSL